MAGIGSRKDAEARRFMAFGRMLRWLVRSENRWKTEDSNGTADKRIGMLNSLLSCLGCGVSLLLMRWRFWKGQSEYSLTNKLREVLIAKSLRLSIYK